MTQKRKSLEKSHDHSVGSKRSKSPGGILLTNPVATCFKSRGSKNSVHFKETEEEPKGTKAKILQGKASSQEREEAT
jgi:hypothetical protein